MADTSTLIWTLVPLGINALLGLIGFEWAWWKLRRFRKPIAELDQQFPELARKDAPLWKKWKLYPGAVTLLVPRLLLVIIFCLLMALLLWLALICHDRRRPLSGCRRSIVRAIVYGGTWLISLVGWFTSLSYRRMSRDQVNFYEEYLGSQEEQRLAQASETEPDERVPKRGPGPCSTVVCNHIGFMEVLNLVVSPLCPGFTPKASIRKMKLVGTIASAIQSIFIERAGTKSQRDELV